jgi:hypothetical protein
MSASSSEASNSGNGEFEFTSLLDVLDEEDEAMAGDTQEQTI